jgi:DNA-binding response OmpR family regulator
MAYILVVDDDPDVLGTVSRALMRDGHDVTKATSGNDAWQKATARHPDLAILDIQMPGMSGLTLCANLRGDPRYHELLIMFLTADNKPEDIINGLDAGGDDYMTKPFTPEELTARVRALLRRVHRDAGNTIEVNGVRLNSDTYQVLIQDEMIQLTAMEHRLLRYLMEHPNQALSPKHLLEAVWDYPRDTGDPDLVRAHVRNLRAKLEKNSRITNFIRTIHGVGYMVSGAH